MNENDREYIDFLLQSGVNFVRRLKEQAAELEALKKEKEDLTTMLALAVEAAGGEVNIPQAKALDTEGLRLIRDDDIAQRMIVFRTERVNDTSGGISGGRDQRNDPADSGSGPEADGVQDPTAGEDVGPGADQDPDRGGEDGPRGSEGVVQPGGADPKAPGEAG